MYCEEDVSAKAERALEEARAGLPLPARRRFSIAGRLSRLWSERRRRRRDEDDSDEADGRPLLAVLAERERLSVLRVNLYPGDEGYSLALRAPDGSEAESFRLRYEERELLRCLDNEELPCELLELLDQSGCRVFVAGCVVAEVRDFRRSVSPELCTSTYVLLRPSQRTILADLNRIFAEGEFTHEERVQIEARIALATAPALCLDPSPAVGLVTNHQQWSHRALDSPALRRAAERRSQPAAARRRRATELPPPPGPLRLHQFLRDKGRLGAPPAKRARCFPPISDLPVVTAPPSAAVEVRQRARRQEFPAEPSRDASLHLREDNAVEWDRGGGRVMHMKLSVYLRPSDDSYHGQLYVDRDYKEGRRGGACCRFPLCCRAAADLYVKQCIEIFTEYGKKSAKLTHQAVGQPPRVTLTRGARERRESQTSLPSAAHSAAPVLLAAQQQQRVALARSSTPALAAQLRTPPQLAARAAPLAAQMAQALGQARVATHKPATPALPPQGSVAAVVSAPQTIQIKVSAQNTQMTQLLQSQLQHIQVTLPQQVLPTARLAAPAPAPTAAPVRQAPTGLQALLADTPSADNPAAGAGVGPSLLEKLVASSAPVSAAAVVTGSGTKLLPLSFRVPNPAATRPDLVTRVERQNPTLTELLNAPPAAGRPVSVPAAGPVPSPAPVPVQPAVPQSLPVPPPAAPSQPPPQAVSGAGGDLLSTALQLVQSGDLLAELENLDSLLNSDGADGQSAPQPPQQQQPQPPPQPQPVMVQPQPAPPPPPPPPPRLLQKSEPPPNVNIRNLLSDGVNVTNLQHLQQGLQTIPGLHNVQVSIPGMSAPISINVGGAPATSAPRVLLTSPPSPAQTLRPAPSPRQSVSPAPLPSPVGASVGLQRPAQFQVLSAVAGRRAAGPVLVTSQAGGAAGQQVYLKTESGAGGQQMILTTQAGAGGQQVILTTQAAGGGAQQVYLKAEPSSGSTGQQVILSSQTQGGPSFSVVQVPTGRLSLTQQQQRLLLQRQLQQAQQRKPSK
ncbi:transcription factor SPT20 homolog [Amphibalanus amphitrite]|uniref:transcription factor SPT20 homolog n=1 Tax=Amphibalanus amphitrite TaxID=1232801 RepID=UPI001C901B62|nr:transcription factor SPT20 homolog [Amphibalanus amphitrite]